MSLIRELIVLILRLLPMVNINHCRNSIKHDQSVLLTLISFSLCFMRRWYCIYHHLAIHFGNLQRFWKGFAVPEILQCTCNINKSAQRQLHIEIPRLSVSNAGTIWLKVGLRPGKMSCFTGKLLWCCRCPKWASSKPTWGHHPVCNVIYIM